MEPMDQIRKEIHTALSYVSQMCEQFFRKYPQHYPDTNPINTGYQPYHYGGYFPTIPQFPPMVINHPNQKNISDQKFPKSVKSEAYQDPSKKSMKEAKKYEKKWEQLRIQREREERQLKRVGDALKNKKKERKTKKNLIKKDPRYAQKPKFPLSPYFLFLQEMRTKLTQGNQNSLIPNKQLAEKMGKQWREMSEESKKSYVMSYLKEKKVFDEKLAKYYEKYPDLKPEGKKYDKPKYAVDDPKYQFETDHQGGELETDLIDELPSEEQNSDQNKGYTNNRNGRNGNTNNNPNGDYENHEEQEYEEEAEWSGQKDSLNEERATADHNGSHLFREVVEID